jgi:hypothetical protein
MKGTQFVYLANARWGEKYAGQLATVTRNDYLHPDEPDIWLVAFEGVERFSMNGSDIRQMIAAENTLQSTPIAGGDVDGQ